MYGMYLEIFQFTKYIFIYYLRDRIRRQEVRTDALGRKFLSPSLFHQLPVAFGGTAVCNQLNLLHVKFLSPVSASCSHKKTAFNIYQDICRNIVLQRTTIYAK
jgi:hypothetical protein